LSLHSFIVPHHRSVGSTTSRFFSLHEKLLRPNRIVPPDGEKAFMVSLPSHPMLNTHASLKEVPFCPELLSYQADDVFALWNAWELECGHECAVPYWAVVWPGASVLARYLLRTSDLLEGKTVLDLGCGGGVAGIAAARAGAAQVICNDIDPVALYVVQQNAMANNVEVDISPEDYLTKSEYGSIDVILVADMFYHREQSESMLRFLQEARVRGTEVLIADGHRPFAPKTGIDLLAMEWIPVNRELEGVSEREVRLLSLC
jgi:predicted nicotinamide N-methyase